jgi:acid stress-induced BolA-like protein IbaG/YrbA
MGKLHKKIIGVLGAKLSDFEDALEDLPGGRISGVVVSSSFKSMNHQARQTTLSKILKGGLSDSELSAVGAIAALTPAEANVKAS